MKIDPERRHGLTLIATIAVLLWVAPPVWAQAQADAAATAERAQARGVPARASDEPVRLRAAVTTVPRELPPGRSAAPGGNR